uniref:Uncharacterized protein n=1 Tax=Panagrolaimus davidi TaxID=227884 RepID=A0A914PJ51_9BILA
MIKFTGCVTDDGIFINETKTVQQKDGFQFNCTKNGRSFTFTKTPPPPPYFPPPPLPHPPKPLSGDCKLGQTKLVSHRFILECQKKENEEQNAFHLNACFSQPKNNKMKRVKVEVGKTFDTFFDRKDGLGIRHKCHSKGDKYFYDEIGCIIGKEFVKPDEIFFNGTDAIFCIQKNLGKLQLKAINPEKLVQKICSKSSEK